MAPLTPASSGAAPARVVSLVGLMGSGKSSVARALAARWPDAVARDLDAVIAEAAGASIAAIFARDGEPAFRALEARCLDAVLASGETLVLATGGGAPCQPGAMDKLLSHGPVVWLDAPPAALVARALGDARPLLAGRSPAEAEAVLTAQLEARRPHYQRATLRVDATRPLEEVADTIDFALHRSP